MTSKFVRNIDGERYLLGTRVVEERDSQTAVDGEPWYATNADICIAARSLPSHNILVRSYCPGPKSTVSVRVSFGKTIPEQVSKKYIGTYRIGCAYFTFQNFKRILRHAGVKGTQKKAFAAKAGV
jgi:hypothetical protein